MPVPSNTTAATATVIPSLPYSVTQDVYDAGTTYEVWFSYTPSQDELISVFGFGSIGGTPYYPRLTVRLPPSGSPGFYEPAVLAVNKPAQLPMTAGVQVYFRFTNLPGTAGPPAVLTLEVEALAPVAAPIGSIVVNDDNPDFPAVIINTSGDVVNYINPVASGEAGDVLDNGKMCFHDQYDSFIGIYTNQGVLITQLTGIDVPSLGGMIRTCQGTQRWWYGTLSGTTGTVRYFTEDSSQGTAHTITGLTLGLKCLAASNDETVLYYVSSTSVGGEKQIRRWNLTTDTAMSDLVAEVTDHFTFDILVLSDDTIIASYIKTTATINIECRRYDAAGTLLNTYAFGSDHVFPNGTIPRLAYGLDATSFWFWTHRDGANEFISRFEEIRVSDGTVLQTVLSREYELGVYEGAITATPDALFGNSYSCPFIVTRASIGPEPPDPTPSNEDYNGPIGPELIADGGLCTLDNIVRVRRATHLADEQQRIFHSKFQLDIEAGVGTTDNTNPKLVLRWSNDGGFTWSRERELNVGKLGEYRYRCLAFQLGMARDRVYEVRQSDPVKSVWLQAFLDIEEGDS